MITYGSEVSASRCSHIIPRRQKLIVPSKRLALKPVWKLGHPFSAVVAEVPGLYRNYDKWKGLCAAVSVWPNRQTDRQADSGV